MTTAQALAAIPEIVEKAIPLTPYRNIKCEVEKKIAIDNALWRREQLADKIKMLIIRHEGNGSVGVRIDLNQLLKDDNKG